MCVDLLRVPVARGSQRPRAKRAETLVDDTTVG